MNGTNRATGVVVCAVILLCAGWVCGQDWPQWRGPGRDGKVTGFNAPQTWPKTLTVKWKAKVGLGDATPALVGDKLYAFTRQGGDEVILCLDAGSGRELWRHKYAAQSVSGPAGRQHPGPRSSPAVADGKVVTLGVAGVVSCVEASTGKLVWRKDPFPRVVPTFFTSMSPIIVDGAAIVHVGGSSQGAIVALDLATGAEKWRWGDEGPEYASPAVLTAEGTKQIVTLTTKSVVGLGAADGKLLWKIPFAPARRAYNAATPIVDGQTVIYTGAGRGTTAVKIEKSGDGFAAKQLWKNGEIAVQYNTPVLTGGLLFGLSDRGNLFCIDAKTGKSAWTDTARHGRGFAAIVAAGSAVLALPSTSELIAFKPSGEAYAELARIKVAETPTYAYPVIAGGRIFVKDNDTLVMSTIE
jgi:outer membrane protein assembly factor BamB